MSCYLESLLFRITEWVSSVKQCNSARHIEAHSERILVDLLQCLLWLVWMKLHAYVLWSCLPICTHTHKHSKGSSRCVLHLPDQTLPVLNRWRFWILRQSHRWRDGVLRLFKLKQRSAEHVIWCLVLGMVLMTPWLKQHPILALPFDQTAWGNHYESLSWLVFADGRDRPTELWCEARGVGAGRGSWELLYQVYLNHEGIPSAAVVQCKLANIDKYSIVYICIP